MSVSTMRFIAFLLASCVCEGHAHSMRTAKQLHGGSIEEQQKSRKVSDALATLLLAYSADGYLPGTSPIFARHQGIPRPSRLQSKVPIRAGDVQMRKFSTKRSAKREKEDEKAENEEGDIITFFKESGYLIGGAIYLAYNLYCIVNPDSNYNAVVKR
mmetsp:Transcript_2786/g.4656  ORF Transcript_2786/g.4656 Transcript_2786/m.4656 type:complete len:157 (+) Transcript_2786:44-514(+)